MWEKRSGCLVSCFFGCKGLFAALEVIEAALLLGIREVLSTADL